MGFLSCKKETDGGSTQDQTFDIKYVKVWGIDALGQDLITINGSAKTKALEVMVKGCDRYKMDYEVKGNTGSKNSRAGEAVVDPLAIEKGASKLYITLSASGFKTEEIRINIERVDTAPPKMKVVLKTSEHDNVVVINGQEYETADAKATVTVLSEGEAVMQKVTIAGSEVTPVNDGKKAEKIDVDTNGNVEVLATFEYYKDYKLAFTLKKVASGEVAVKVLSATVFSGDNYEKSKGLTFKKENGVFTASVKPENIEYSLVKLEMQLDSVLKVGCGLKECKDGRSANYKTNPSGEDGKGIFSGRLVKEEDKDGKVIETYTPINEKTYTEYLIVGAGAVEYKFEFEAEGRKKSTYVVKITNENNNKVKFAGNDATFYTSHDYGTSMFLSGPPVWRWTTYSKLPVNGEDSWASIADLEYMSDRVKMLFAKINAGVQGEMYFYYNVFDSESSKLHDFVRVKGEPQGGAYFTHVSFDPEEKYVDAFVGFKDYLPQPLLPLQLQKKWKKIVDKGFLFQVENKLKYVEGKNEVSVIEIFYDVFNYRVQAKTYEGNQTLNIGYSQKYGDMLSGDVKSISNKFLDGDKKADGTPNDLMIMIPTFAGKIADSISTATYSIKKNGAEEAGWQNVNIPVDKLGGYICLNAKPENYADGGRLKDAKTMYAYEKGSKDNENKYEIDVTITPKTGTAKTYKYKIDYKTEQTQTLMSLHSGTNMDSNIFGVPTSYAECANREVQAMFREAMGQSFARERLINR